jgi:YgiT-type zinc finger domain-containing protein
MKCFECGGEVLKTLGTVKMTRSDDSFIIFKGIPMTQCHQCGEQYISGKWSEKIRPVQLGIAHLFKTPCAI